MLRQTGYSGSFSQYASNKTHTQFPSYPEYMQGRAMGNPYYVTYNNGKPTPVAYQRAFYTNNQSNNPTNSISRDAPEVYDVTGGQGYSCGRDNVNQYFSSDSNVYGLLIGGLSITFKGLFQGLSLSVKNAVRPANIGAGIFAKNIKQELSEIARLDSGFGTALNILAYGAVAIDVGQGIYNNIQSGATTTEILSDAVVDTVITGGGVLAATELGAAIGTALFPGAGTVAGALVGGGLSILFSVLTDYVDWSDGNTFREEVKVWARSLW